MMWIIYKEGHLHYHLHNQLGVLVYTVCLQECVTGCSIEFQWISMIVTIFVFLFYNHTPIATQSLMKSTKVQTLGAVQ